MVFIDGVIGVFSWRMEMHTVYLCIGGNLGDRLANLEETLDFITFNMGEIEATSSIYESVPWGMQSTDNFLNQIVRIQTELTPLQLLEEIKELEEYYGRERKPGQYLSREMDVDVLFWNDEVIELEELAIPHPRLEVRRFVLLPMNELAPDFVHPVSNKKISELLGACQDESKVTLYASV